MHGSAGSLVEQRLQSGSPQSFFWRQKWQVIPAVQRRLQRALEEGKQGVACFLEIVTAIHPDY